MWPTVTVHHAKPYTTTTSEAGTESILDDMFRVVIQIGQLEVRCETDKMYPDAAQDVTNRAREALRDAVTLARKANWVPVDVEVVEEEEEESSETLDNPPAD